jgi:hypothetical protein
MKKVNVFEPGFQIRIDLMRIRIHHFLLRIQTQLRIRIQFRIKGFDDQKFKKIWQLKKKFNLFF